MADKKHTAPTGAPTDVEMVCEPPPIARSRFLISRLSLPIVAAFLLLTFAATPNALSASGPTTVTRRSGERRADPMEMVNLSKIAPTILIEIKWANADNLLGRPAYALNRCHLRRAAAERLARAQKRLEAQGLGLKVWEGYRPMWMQRLLWETVKNPNLVSNPSRGRRTHIRGVAVDVTLVDALGVELEMPTGYCEFSKREQMEHAYMKLPQRVIENRTALKQALEAEGFEAYKNEWWHYNLKTWKDFPILREPKLVQLVQPANGPDEADGPDKAASSPTPGRINPMK